MSPPKVHYEFRRRKCNCGDSYCGECRDFVTATACGASTRTSDQRTELVDRVTCLQCKATRLYKFDTRPTGPCKERTEHLDEPYSCSLPAGHPGPHEAKAFVAVHKWSTEKRSGT